MTDDDLGCGKHDAVFVIDILATVHTVEDLGLHLLNGCLLLVNLCEILFHAALEVIQYFLPIIKYIIHNRPPYNN